jgi:hypothetical protein
MARAVVKELLHRIEALDDKDRMELELALARNLEKQWAKEAPKLRKIARRRGITQDVIDRAIERRRYGR